MSHPHPDLDAPADHSLRALCGSIPLGGLGEVGRNMTVFEYDGKLLIVDCGVLFPDETPARRRPDPAGLRSRSGPPRRRRRGGPDARPRGPHRRGALPAAAARATSRVIGSQLTLALLEAKLQGAPDHRPCTLQTVVEGETASRSGRSTASSSRSTTRSRTRSRWRSRTAGRHGAAHRRLQDGPVAAGRPDHRPARVRPARRGGRRPVHGRLHQRRGARASPRPSATSRRCWTGSSPTREQRIIVASLRLARAPGAAGAGRRGTARPQGRAASAARWCATWASPGPRLPERARTAC